MYAGEEYSGYLFVYFTDDGKGGGEEVYFALSKGNDPLHWQELIGGKPLKVHGNGNWNRCEEMYFN